jgi:thiamine biosynthesis lipoprotein
MLTAEVPDMELLLAANEFTDINDVIIDKEANTVFLRHEGMSLDVGGIAKGFAIEIITQRLLESGLYNFTLSVGGDVRVIGQPHSADRDYWGIGMSDPRHIGDMIGVIFRNDTAVFSSGDYQRYFIADGQRYHHIIDPRTLMPSDRYMSVWVIYPDGGIADMLVTAAFILDIPEAKEMLARFEAEALWLFADGSIISTDGFDYTGTS